MWFRAHAHKNYNKIFILKYVRCRDGKRTETRIGMEVSVLPIPAFHHCEPLWCNARMGNTDTLHPNSCFCSFSIPTSDLNLFYRPSMNTTEFCLLFGRALALVA